MFISSPLKICCHFSNFWKKLASILTNWSIFNFEVYDGKGALEEGETAVARFIKIQAAYELLIDVETRRQYDMDNRVNPMKVRYAIICNFAWVYLDVVHCLVEF